MCTSGFIHGAFSYLSGMTIRSILNQDASFGALNTAVIYPLITTTNGTIKETISYFKLGER